MIAIPMPFSIKGNEKKIIKAVDRLNIDRSENLSFIDPNAVKVAAVPMKLRPYRRLEDFVEHVFEKTGLAVKGGAQLVCLPELIGFAPLLMLPKYEHLLAGYKLCATQERGQYINDILYEYIGFIQEVYFTTFSELACQHGVFLLAGSLYLFEGEKLHNRAYLFDPDGDVVAYQDKLNLTEDEISIGVVPGQSLQPMDTKLGRICVAIGQDNCYFEVYRIAKEMGAQVMLAPTCNLNFGIRHPDWADAYLRVQETSLFAVKSSMSGSILHRHFGGVAGIYSPASICEERYGIVASSENNLENPLVSRVNLTRLDRAVNPLACDENHAFSAEFAARHYGKGLAVADNVMIEDDEMDDNSNKY